MLKRILSVGVGALVLGLALLGAGQALTISGTNTEWRNSIFQVGILRISRDETITAFAGGGQTSAYQLTAGLNRVATVGSANDSVKLPACLGGKVVIVINAAASNSMNVYGQTGETINAIAADSPFALAANKMAVFACAIDGKWYSALTA